MATLEGVNIENKLVYYDCQHHIPSDIVTGEQFLPEITYKSQANNDALTLWTRNNKIKLNIQKFKFMVFSKKMQPFMEGIPLEKRQEMIHLGSWITSDLT